MSVSEQYAKLLEARVEALEKEVNHLKNFIIRDYSLKGIGAETVMDMYNNYKKNETEI
jgi:cob(I)alamin adenosyltransferase